MDLSSDNAAATVKLAKIIKIVIGRIQTYESDTFSAEGSGITEAEATEILANLIASRIDPGNNLDGVTIQSCLDDIRHDDEGDDDGPKESHCHCPDTGCVC